MTVRKNFLFDEKTARHLEVIAKAENISQTDVIRKLIEDRYQNISREEKLQAFYSIIPFPAGSLTDKSIQSVKAEMDV